MLVWSSPQISLSIQVYCLACRSPRHSGWAAGWFTKSPADMGCLDRMAAAFVALLTPRQCHTSEVVSASAPARALMLHPQETGGTNQSRSSCYLLRLRPGLLPDARHQAGAALFAAQTLHVCPAAAACGGASATCPTESRRAAKTGCRIWQRFQRMDLLLGPLPACWPACQAGAC